MALFVVAGLLLGLVNGIVGCLHSFGGGNDDVALQCLAVVVVVCTMMVVWRGLPGNGGGDLNLCRCCCYYFC